MIQQLRRLAGLAVGVAMAIGFSSCAYDPYYSSAGGSYSTGGGGYGDGYGYGNSSFSTSLFVSTGDPRWGYDPYAYSYYDYQRRAYYDPYLNGYYPVGYRPVAVYGVPHPYGWSSGHGHIRPPAHYRDYRISNYRNRATAYRNTNYDWARQVRERPSSNRVVDTRPARNNYEAQRPNNRPGTSQRPPAGSRSQGKNQYREQSRPPVRQQATPASRQRSAPATRKQPSPSYRQESRPAPSQRGSSRSSSKYNTPVSVRESSGRSFSPPPQRQANRAQAAPAPSRQSRDSGRNSRRDSDVERGGRRGR